MKTIIRNFFSVLRRFKMASLLNTLGLSVAFAAFLVIMMQVSYDARFDASIPDADNIYRLNITFDGRQIAVAPRPLGEEFANFSPHVKAMTVANTMGAGMLKWFFSVDNSIDKQVYAATMTEVTGGFIDVFQPEMTEGSARAMLEPDKVLIPQSLSQTLFDGGSAVGRQLRGEDFNWTVGGVYKDFAQNSSVGNSIYKQMPIHQNIESWGNFNYEIFVRMEEGQDTEQLFANYKETITPDTYKKIGLANVDFFITPLKELHFATAIEFDTVEKTSRATLWVLISIAFVILLIAAINFTNYSIALTPLRIKSVNTQKVLGATERSIRGSLVVEAVTISFISFLLALFVVHLLSLSPVVALLDTNLVLHNYVPLIILVGLVAILTGLFAGIYPAYYITSFAPALVLKGSFGLSPRGRQLRSSLVGVQFVASFALIIVAMFMYMQTKYMQDTNMGYDKDQVIVTNMNKQFDDQHEMFANELKAILGIESISFSESLLAGNDSYSTWARDYKEENIMFQAFGVDIDFLQTLQIPLTEGRDFTKNDTLVDEEFFIFNEYARKEFGMSVGDKIEGGTVIGVIPDINIASLRREIEPMAFYLYSQNTWLGRQYAYLHIKSGSDKYQELKQAKEVLERLSPGYPFNIRFLNEISDNLYGKENNLTLMITLFSLIAVLISMVGVFGLVVFESEYRRKEIGVRKVLGSTTGQILEMFNKRYIYILGICFLIAAPISWYAVGRWLENFAYRTPMYWWIFALAFLIIASLTSATVTFQSWRVADANPVDSIKTE